MHRLWLLAFVLTVSAGASASDDDGDVVAHWVLILTLPSENHTPTAISSVPGFSSEEACSKAGKLWWEEQRTQLANWVCSEQ